MRGSVAVALLIGVLLGCGAAEPETPSERRQAPNFILTTLRGETLSLGQLRGKPVVIDFWATWCAPCVHQIPILNDFQLDHGEDVPVLGISLDQDAEVIRAFLEEHPIRYRVLQAKMALPRSYGAIGFPTLYVLDGEGGIVFEHAGIVDREELDRAVAEAQGS